MALKMWSETDKSMSEFWDLSIHEFNYAIEGFQKRNQRQEELAVTQAYLTAKFVWTKKLPDLQKILGKKETKKIMTDDQMKQIAMTLNKLYGGEVIRDGN